MIKKCWKQNIKWDMNLHHVLSWDINLHHGLPQICCPASLCHVLFFMFHVLDLHSISETLRQLHTSFVCNCICCCCVAVLTGCLKTADNSCSQNMAWALSLHKRKHYQLPSGVHPQIEKLLWNSLLCFVPGKKIYLNNTWAAEHGKKHGLASVWP